MLPSVTSAPLTTSYYSQLHHDYPAGSSWLQSIPHQYQQPQQQEYIPSSHPSHVTSHQQFNPSYTSTSQAPTPQPSTTQVPTSQPSVLQAPTFPSSTSQASTSCVPTSRDQLPNHHPAEYSQTQRTEPPHLSPLTDGPRSQGMATSNKSTPFDSPERYFVPAFPRTSNVTRSLGMLQQSMSTSPMRRVRSPELVPSLLGSLDSQPTPKFENGAVRHRVNESYRGRGERKLIKGASW